MTSACHGRFTSKRPEKKRKEKIFEVVTTLFLFILSCLFSDVSMAKFPEQYYPGQDRPRLWISAERSTAFAAAQAQGTQRWLEYKDLCDSLIDSDPSNDPWDLDHAPQHYTAPLALMYLLTNDSRYADRCLELMDDTPTDFSGYGDPDHESYHYLGLAYDWLHGYSAMTEAKKTAYRTKMKTVSDQFWTEDNLNASGTDSDQNLLTMTIHLFFGVAMYGDDPDAVDLLDRAWKGWDEGYYFDSGTSNRDLVKHALGGAYFTGFAYFNSTDSRGIAGFWLAMETACGYDIDTEEPELKPFWPAIVRSAIHLTEPGRERIYHYGSWQDPNALADQNWMHRAMTMAAYFSDQAGYGQEAALARGFAANVDLGYHSAEFEEFFFDTPGAAAANPYKANLPLVRFADEPDFLLFRDNWTASANWGMFIGDGSVPFDHQSPDHGHFFLWRENDYLTKGARSYESMMNGDFFNTLSIENACSVNGNSCSGTAIFDSEQRASISRHREGYGSLLFAYGMLEADGQWNDNPEEYQPVSNVESYRRHFFWADPYVVVFDRLRTKTPGWAKYRLRAMAEPSIDGDTVSQLSANGEHKLLQRTLEPSGATIQKIDESVLWSDLDDWIVNASERSWQSVVDIPATTSANILNVMQAGPSSMSHFDTLENLTGGGNAGVRIGDWVVLFSSEEGLRTAVDYDVANNVSGTRHLVADLEAGQYQVSVDGETVSVVVVEDGDNTALFQLEQQSSPTISVTLQVLEPEIIYVDNVNDCASMPPDSCRTTIQEGIGIATGPLVYLMVTGSAYFGGMQADVERLLYFSGGWDSSFASDDGETVLSGGVIVGNGTFEVKKLTLK